MTRKSRMGPVRRGGRHECETGFLITWDIDSKDRRAVDRVRRFVFGHRVHANGTTYRYPGFVFRPGVRYLGQSAIFVRPGLRDEIRAFLEALGVDHESIPATVG